MAYDYTYHNVGIVSNKENRSKFFNSPFFSPPYLQWHFIETSQSVWLDICHAFDATGYTQLKRPQRYNRKKTLNEAIPFKKTSKHNYTPPPREVRHATQQRSTLLPTNHLVRSTISCTRPPRH
ncbi:hypothetical protein CDAR_457351 [Caerostris darwini]|uniref:Uncharacterized protein n=1 Tax=Caerostris darwini TaxID=1538125 RepID=A0AAV4PEX7_9ARAC|nr:hypothetical protein CDAR_457351 [Caerostris darwini]